MGAEELAQLAVIIMKLDHLALDVAKEARPDVMAIRAKASDVYRFYSGGSGRYK
jgi:hypothetical protein